MLKYLSFKIVLKLFCLGSNILYTTSFPQVFLVHNNFFSYLLNWYLLYKLDHLSRTLSCLLGLAYCLLAKLFFSFKKKKDSQQYMFQNFSVTFQPMCAVHVDQIRIINILIIAVFHETLEFICCKQTCTLLALSSQRRLYSEQFWKTKTVSLIWVEGRQAYPYNIRMP